MQILFSRYFKGSVFPGLLDNGPFFQKMSMGPKKLLEELAQQLGISSKPTSGYQRTSLVVEHIRKSNNTKAFYAESFTLDPWGVSRRLLELRDQIYLYGYQGDNHSFTNLRLRDLFALNNCPAFNEGKDCLIEKIIKILATKPTTGINSIEIIHPADELSPLWLRLFDALAAAGIAISYRATPPFRLPAEVLRIEASNPREAAELLANLLNNQQKSDTTTKRVFLHSERFTAPLMAGFAAQQLPVPFSLTPSSHRQAWQILRLLPVFFQNLPDPHQLSQFLTIHNGPLPRKLAFSLDRTLQRTPSHLSPAWQAAVEKFTTEEPELWEKCQKSYFDFFQASKSTPDNSLDVTFLLLLLNHLSTWAERQRFRCHLDNNNAAHGYSTIKDKIADLSVILKEQKNPRIQPEEYHQFLTMVEGQGFSLPGNQLKLENLAFLPDENHVEDSCDQLIWWTANRSTLPSLQKSFWSEAEQGELKEHSVEFPTISKQTLIRRRRWQRAIYLTKKQLVIVNFPENSTQNAYLAHPLLKWLEKQMGKTNPITWNHNSTTSPHISFTEYQNQPLPTPQVYWNFSPEFLSNDSFERPFSPTSLNSLLSCPLQWFFRYALELKTPDSLAANQGARFAGLVCHDTFDAYFTDCQKQPSKKKEILRSGMDLIIKTKYAILLQPIYQDILLHLKNDGLEGLEFLTDWLIGKEIDSVATEQSLEGTFKGINIKGIADLIASKMGANYLIDLKWSGRNRFMKELQMNREIQLGAYCQMLPQTEINPAYYIIRDKEFLTPTAAAFNAMDYQFEASPEATFLASMDVVNSISSTIKTGTIHCRGIDETINEELTVMENTDKTRRIAATSPIQAKFKNGCFFCDYGVICGKGRNQS